MPAEADPWSELREFDLCEPSPLAFRAIVALLDTWTGGDRAGAIEYAGRLLSRWPDAVRLAPWSWCKAATKGAVPPTWRLARALQLESGHLIKGTIDLARLARRADLDHITELEIPRYSESPDLSLLHHRPQTFPALKVLRATDRRGDGEVRALAGSPLWRTLESFEVRDLDDSLVHRADASRIVPKLDDPGPLRHLTLRSPDLIAVWERTDLPHLRSAAVIVRSIDESRTLARRPELAGLTSLSLAFRCGFSGSSPFEPFLGNVIEADEAAAEAFFRHAGLEQLEELTILGYTMGYWGREGLGRLGLETLIASKLLRRLKRLCLKRLPLGDAGIAALAPALGDRLETLELVDVYCKGDGAAALCDSPCMASLRHLDLSANRIDGQGAARLAGVDMPHLRTLDLSGPEINPYYWNIGQQPIRDEGAAAWAESRNARQLTRLRLRNGHLTDDALIAIFGSPQLRTLEELDLSDNAFTAAAIARGSVGSPLWRTLRQLGLSHCRLDDAAIESLARVDRAPALRSLQLGYNSIGPRGAAALAGWPVLARVWELGLRDNAIGDRGLIALAGSPHLGRLVELDLEQDCWNSRAFTFNDEAARALASSPSLARLDALFSGCVDEYHGAAYSPGFSKQGIDALRGAEGMRPAFRASCGDFSGISDYIESPGFDEATPLNDHDFRQGPYELNEREAEPGRRGMQQVRLPTSAAMRVDEEEPPAILPTLPEPDEDEEDIVEGIEFRDATPPPDISLDLSLSLVDEQRPLPGQVGKVLSDTLGRLLNACGMGSFDVTGSMSCGDVETEDSFAIGIRGEPEPAIRLIREALWWLGAPADTDLDGFPLDLAREPADPAARFVQLVTPTVARWRFRDTAGHRIDLVPFIPAQREGIRRVLREAGAVEDAGGWAGVATGDGGRAAFSTRYLDGGPEFDALNVLIDALTPGICGPIHMMMQRCGLMAWPMAIAASPEAARAIDCDWPKVEVVSSSSALHRLLARGPFRRWHRASGTIS
ncbi:Leucine Rich repeats (2 copies) [Aquisphaera giovannonii]|uniref:Leucine Rich repeats (2 copies) n=1 Tax=Aquisphaera giovannonii TaxID=406548 RepID=A0A5B9W2F3_9BACT|nr:hypothetical protein [Aquisphaera giovannonii]QEH34449.1 Leucine Rich repeats (2 copies) [Aquisphaera giovannonii]